MIFAKKPGMETLRDSVLPLLAVLAAILLAIAIIHWIRNRYRDREDHAAGELGMLLHLNELRREGDLTDEEFRSIQSRLSHTEEGSARGADSEQLEALDPKQD